MTSAAIQTLRARKYGCLRDVTVDLTPLHAFIGPNDSGKSTILRAVRTAVQFATGTFYHGNDAWLPFDPGVENNPECSLRLDLVRDALAYELTEKDAVTTEHVHHAGDPTISIPRPTWNTPGLLSTKPALSVEATTVKARLLGGARLLRLDPDALRRPSQLIPETEKLRLQDERGLGLPAVYDAILNRGDDSFRQIVEDVRRLFPTIKNLRLKVTSSLHKALEVELVTGERVPAQFMSEGLLYYLAFVAVRHLEATSILLVEEPENGLHPARIREIMRILRALSETTQVLLATHSPLVINEMRGDEVTVVTRDAAAGTRVTRLCDTPNFDERSRVYALGELWVSYANGDDEAPLFTEPEEAPDPGEPWEWQDPDEPEGERS